MRGLGEIAERLRRSTVQVIVGRRGGTGSGIVWSTDGVILTAAHVARTQAAAIELWDGRRFDAQVVARDPRRDLAALRVATNGLEAATPGDSASLRPGELVLAIGNPLGFAGALSTGVVHSIGALPGMGRQHWIRADVRLAPGNSGGPLANAKGQVVGINTAIVNGLGLAVPASAVEPLLRRGGRRQLGVTLRPMPRGLMILEVDPTGAAAASSLRVGDLLLGSFDELNDALDSGADVLRLQFLRGDRAHVREVSVRVGAPAGVL
jgi:serine protease Do